MSAKANIPSAEPLELASLITYTEDGISSRVISQTPGGSVTLFAFDKGQELSEHTAPFEVLLSVLEGTLAVTVSGTRVRVASGEVVRIPSGATHSLQSPTRSKMMLVMLRGRTG